MRQKVPNGGPGASTFPVPHHPRPAVPGGPFSPEEGNSSKDSLLIQEECPAVAGWGGYNPMVLNVDTREPRHRQGRIE